MRISDWSSDVYSSDLYDGHLADLAEQGVDRKPEREVQDDPDDGGGNRAQRGGERAIASHPLDEGSPREDPEIAGHERHPSGENRPQRGGNERRQAGRFPKRGKRTESRRVGKEG